jgi:23S rRNA U2552 (ribose-2'-O)-methylase RlmE/FtsJ
MSSYLLNDFLFCIDHEEIQMKYLHYTQPQYYINLSLKEYLSKIKKEIDKNPDKWEQFKKITNKYEFINTPCIIEKMKINHCVCRYKPISRSYFKMIEILHSFSFDFPDVLTSFHLAEGPGGFIEALQKYRKNDNDCYVGMTLMQDNKDIPRWNKIQSFMKRHHSIQLEHGPKNDGNLYFKHNIDYIKEHHKNKYFFITADGGFDYSVDFNKQEESSLNLIFCEILYALLLQKQGGSFVLKVFDIFHNVTLELLFLLCYFYEQVYIFKPHTSREANSERYIICKRFSIKANYENIIEKLLYGFKDLSKQNLNGLFRFELNSYFLCKIQEINAIFGQQQVENILSTLNYIKEGQMIHREKVDKIKVTNIERCIKWCKEHQQPVHEDLGQLLNC